MSTQSGVLYHPSQSNLESTMDNDIKAMLKSITEKLDNLCDRVQTLEDHHSAPAEPESPRTRPHDPALDSDFEATLPTPCHEPK